MATSFTFMGRKVFGRRHVQTLTPLQDFTKSWIRIASKDWRGSLFTGEVKPFDVGQKV